jgi:hypothetical protein
MIGPGWQPPAYLALSNVADDVYSLCAVFSAQRADVGKPGVQTEAGDVQQEQRLSITRPSDFDGRATEADEVEQKL